MATATLTKRRPKTRPAIPTRAQENLNNNTLEEDDLSTAFYMPAGSMTLDEFRQWTYSDEFPTTGLITYLGEEIFFDMSPERIVSHGSVKVAVCGVIANLGGKKRRGRLFIDSTRFTHPSAKVSN